MTGTPRKGLSVQFIEALLQILEMPYFCHMQSPRSCLRTITAAFLLVLFACILVEKNLHGHNPPLQAGCKAQAVIHSGFKCLICDFQLAADTDLPLPPAINEFVTASIFFPEPLPLIFFTCSPYGPAERGPPVSC